MKKVVIFGTGGGADTASRYFMKDGRHRVVGYAVDGDRRSVDSFRGLPVVDFERIQEVFPPDEFLLFILLGFQGMSALRIEKYNQGKSKGYSYASYVAPNIFHIEDLSIGENCFILENQTINLDAKIGNNVVMWSGNHLGDRSIVEDHVWISSQVAIGGDARIGEGSFLGMHATIGHGAKIGKKNFIGAGALVTKNTKDGSVYVVENSKIMPMNSEDFSKFF